MPNHNHDCDNIDFPVSDDWLAYYHSRGLTCRSPVRPQGDYQPDTEVAIENRQLHNELAVLHRHLASLERQLRSLKQPALQQENKAKGLDI